MRVLGGLVLLGIALAAAPAAAEEWKPEWKTSYAAAYKAGKESRRPLLIVIDKPAGSYPVEPVSSDAPPQASEAALLASFELCRIDASTAYGQKVAAQFGATQFPYTAITDRKVEVLLYEKAGRMSEGEWTAALARHRSGLAEAPPPAVVCHT